MVLQRPHDGSLSSHQASYAPSERRARRLLDGLLFFSVFFSFFLLSVFFVASFFWSEEGDESSSAVTSSNSDDDEDCFSFFTSGFFFSAPREPPLGLALEALCRRLLSSGAATGRPRRDFSWAGGGTLGGLGTFSRRRTGSAAARGAECSERREGALEVPLCSPSQGLAPTAPSVRPVIGHEVVLGVGYVGSHSHFAATDGLEADRALLHIIRRPVMVTASAWSSRSPTVVVGLSFVVTTIIPPVLVPAAAAVAALVGLLCRMLLSFPPLRRILIHLVPCPPIRTFTGLRRRRIIVVIIIIRRPALPAVWGDGPVIPTSRRRITRLTAGFRHGYLSGARQCKRRLGR